jgi:uncharacterized protein YktA (UPF0223 family)
MSRFLFTVRECDPTKVQTHFKNTLQEEIQTLLAVSLLPVYIEHGRHLTSDGIWYFTTDVILGEFVMATGEGVIRKESEAEAASKALQIITQIKKRYEGKISLEEFLSAYHKLEETVPNLRKTNENDLRRVAVVSSFEHVSVMSELANVQEEEQIRERILNMLMFRRKQK